MNIENFTRAQAERRITACTTVAEVMLFSTHRNAHVRRRVEAKCRTLMALQESRANQNSAEDMEFRRLKERFEKEGKKNPEASARASMLARRRKSKKQEGVENSVVA